MLQRVGDERRRQSYLKALGIPVWVPRFVLPLAKPSPQAEWTDEESVEGVASVAATDPGARQSAPLSVADHLQGVVDAVARQMDPAPVAPVVQAPPASPGLPEVEEFKIAPPRAPAPAPVEISAEAEALHPSFKLALVATDCGVLVVESLAPDRPHFTSAQQRLLAEMLFALGFKPGDIQPHIFDWPPVAKHDFDKSARAAREMLAAAVVRRVDEGAGIVLALGEQACEYLLEQPWREARGALHQALEARLLVSHSLGAMLDEPGLKAETWRDLAGKLHG